MALECFKISYKLSPTVSKTTTYGKNSFKCLAAVLWNDLPDDFRKKNPVLINLKTFHGRSLGSNITEAEGLGVPPP
jgi:hypothetical protein